MTTLLVFAVCLVLAVLVSELADRSVISTAVLFLFAGFIAGRSGWNLIVSHPQDRWVQTIAEMALCSVLFTDGMRASVRDIAKAWRLPGRALLLGLPLTLIVTALLAHWLAGIPWLAAFLLGAILCPTDPVFAAAIVGRAEIPPRLRFLLNVESGINDGLALPIVLALLAVIGHDDVAPLRLAGELLWGVTLGVIVPWSICRLHRTRLFGVAKSYQPLFALAVGLITLCIAAVTHGNIFLAAFAAGITITSVEPDLRDEFHQFGELIAELLKLGALLLFGAMIAPHYFADIHLSGFLFAVAAIFVARPIALLISLAGSGLSWREQLTAAWFGPKGFASVIYAFLLLNAGVPDAVHLFHLVAIVIALSMIAHSSTDVLIARSFLVAEKKDREPD